MKFPAIVTAGDTKAAKVVRGESKVYLEIAGRPLVAHAVATLQRVPEVSAVWVVGNAQRLETALGGEELRLELRKPLHIVPQFRNLYENAWQTYRRLLPGAPPEGRDPETGDLDFRVLYLSADIPFATPQEISQFIQGAVAEQGDFSLGVVTAESMESFYPGRRGEPGIRMAYFNTREGRLRLSNLHLVRPARIVNRSYIEEMYEHRHQREFGDIAGLAWRLLRSEGGGVRIVVYYGLMQLASIADRSGLRRLADRIRQWIPLSKIEAALSSLLRASFRVVITDVGGCALDIDNAHDYDAARARFEEWSKAQQQRAERLVGAAALPPPAQEVEARDRCSGEGGRT